MNKPPKSVRINAERCRPAAFVFISAQRTHWRRVMKITLWDIMWLDWRMIHDAINVAYVKSSARMSQ